MLMFRPEADPMVIPALAYRKQPDWMKCGEQARAIFDVLRTAEGPLTTIDVTDRIIQARGVIGDDRTAHRKRIYKALVQQRRRGLIIGVPFGGRLRWQLSRKGEVSDPEAGGVTETALHLVDRTRTHTRCGIDSGAEINHNTG
jgi:hypothetical protein